MIAVLISTYELGRQPFGLASPAAWLREEGATVTCLDLSVQKLPPDSIQAAKLIAFYLPMHTATRIALQAIPVVRKINPLARLCAYGLYAPLNAKHLQDLGVGTIFGGEFEDDLRNLVREMMGPQGPAAVNQDSITVSLRKQKFLIPDRSGLPHLKQYAQLQLPDGTRQIVGYTEASRGCKHLCRHCPVVPVYNGTFRIVQRDIILEDIRRQAEMGAQHITFGDPDFFNGIGHAIAVVQSLHLAFPHLTYDVTIKVEHLLKHSKWLTTLRDTGCSFVTSAVESVDDKVLEILDKGHTRSDFIQLVRLCRDIGLNLVPTFVTFTPWLTLENYHDLLSLINDLGLVENVPSVQLSIRLLIPNGSLLLERPEIKNVLGSFDEAALSYRWAHPDPRVDELQRQVAAAVTQMQARQATRSEVFRAVWNLTSRAIDVPHKPLPLEPGIAARCTIPYLTEPWFC